jgi:ParB family chromosome partitioning protein
MSDISGSEIPLRFSQSEGVIDLAKSISEKGLLHPIIVRFRNDYKYEIVAGNRRFMACKMLKSRKISCQIVELDDKNAYEVSLIENIQRRTLTPIEEAHAFEKYVKEFGWGGATELSTKIGKSISYITKKIRLLDLPTDVINSINSYDVNTSIAEEILIIKDKSKQSELIKFITEENLSVRDTRNLLIECEKSSNHDWVGSVNIVTSNDKYTANLKKLNKSISILRIAMLKLGDILSDLNEESKQDHTNSIDPINSDNWMLYEILLFNKHMLHEQIDKLIKEKYKQQRYSIQNV